MPGPQEHFHRSSNDEGKEAKHESVGGYSTRTSGYSKDRSGYSSEPDSHYRSREEIEGLEGRDLD